MLLIILAIVLIVIAGNSTKVWLFLIGLFFAAYIMFVGAFTPLHGYEESVLQERYELTYIYPDTNVYAILDSDGSVTCKHLNEERHFEELYTYETNVEVKIVEEGSKPVLEKRLLMPKTSILAMAKGCTKTEYVIYVPESLLERWQNEHVN